MIGVLLIRDLACVPRFPTSTGCLSADFTTSVPLFALDAVGHILLTCGMDEIFTVVVLLSRMWCRWDDGG